MFDSLNRGQNPLEQSLELLDLVADSDVDYPNGFLHTILLFLTESHSGALVRKMNLEAEGFESRLYDRWSEPLDMLRMYIGLNQNIASWHYDHDPELLRTEKGQALHLLLERACEVARQNHALLRTGYPDGAIGRWRTLHEISVHARIIAKHENETAERFLDYYAITNYHHAEIYQKHRNYLGFESISSEALKNAKRKKEEVVAKYGPDFDDNGQGRGWLEHLSLDSSMDSKAKDVGLYFLHPFYELANSRIHSGAKGALWRTGQMYYPGDTGVQFGASNYGLTDPGQLSALSLSYVTSAVLSQSLTPSKVVAIQLLDSYANEIAIKFGHSSEKLQKDEDRIRYNRLQEYFSDDQQIRK